MDEADAPHGVNMSLDDIIKENSKGKNLQNKNSRGGQQFGKTSNHQQGSRGRGRGRGGRGFGRGGARGGQNYGGRGQQQAEQSYSQNYGQGFVQPERIVVVQEELPDTSYRQVSGYLCLALKSQLQAMRTQALKTSAVIRSIRIVIEMSMAMSSSPLKTLSL